MVNVSFPANASFLSSLIIEILNVDLISPDFINDKIFDFTPYYDLIEQFNSSSPSILLPTIQEMGFETFNPILNL
jgi:hypothetical protein